MDLILDSLNEKQREAVLATEGYYRIIAGAGSGKTKTLTHRFAYLVRDLGVPDNRILCVTFTNKAAGEMRERVKTLLDTSASSEFICTFHSFCVKVLRLEIQRLGYQQTFKILDVADQKTILKEVFKELGITSEDGLKVKDAISRIEKCKNGDGWEHLVDLLIAENDPIIPADAEILDQVLLRYLAHQRKNLALDFNDLISFTLYLFQRNKDVLRNWAERFNYIMVDETQDNSYRQWKMLELLSGTYKNLFVVGDPDQAIYSFRGARPDALVNFNKVFTPCTTIVLDENYRSTPTILAAANDIIKQNRMRVEKNLYTRMEEKGSKINWYHGLTEKYEAAYVAEKMTELMEQGLKPEDMAVLYRNSHLSRSVEQAFIQQGIKYQVFGGIRFFERAEIKDTIAYLTMAAYPDDNLAFMRTINYPSRKLGKKFVERVSALAKKDGLSLYGTLSKYYGKEKEITKKTAGEYLQLISKLQVDRSQMSVSNLLAVILDETGILNELRKEEDSDRLDNVIELQNSILSYEKENEHEEDNSLERYLQDISLFTNADSKDKEDTVKLMTIHQAKGLEFPHVFLIGMNEGILPSQRSMADLRRIGLEEERRLAYVAVTRAKEHLYITENEGTPYGGVQRIPSRFILEIQESRIRRLTRVPEYLLSSTRTIVRTENLDEDDNAELFSVGTRVTHRIYGNGTVERIDILKGEYLIRFDRLDRVLAIRTDFSGLSVEINPNASMDFPQIPPLEEKEKEKIDETIRYKTGDHIVHPLYGSGTITQIQTETNQYMVRISNGGFTIPVDFTFDGLVRKK